MRSDRGPRTGRSGRRKLVVGALTLAAATHALACSSGGASATPATSAAGGSQAVCSPSPCRPGPYVTYSVSTDDGAGKQVQRTFAVIRPVGLTNAPSNRAPLVVDINNGTWSDLAAQNRFVVVVMPNNVHCPGGGTSNCQYAGVAANPDPGSIGAHDCGPAGNAACDDAPWVSAALDAVQCSGAPPCQNIDTTRVFASGSSKGAFMVNDLMCDPLTSRRFSGYQAISIPLISPSTANDQRALPRCAAVLGKNPNVNFSAQWILGDKDPVFSGRCPSHVACLEGGFTDAKNRWNFGMAQLAGDSRFGRRVFGAALGCSATPVTTQDTPHVIRKVYDSCSVPGTATSYVKVVGGGHGRPGVSGVDGFDPNAESWRFWLAHPGSTDTAPAAVVITRPRAGQRTSRRALRFAGVAKDPSGVAAVTLTVQQLGTGSQRCRWLDPRKGVVTRACASPVTLTAKLGKAGRWSYAIPRATRLPAGRYRVRVSAQDRAGNAGNSAGSARRTVSFTVR